MCVKGKELFSLMGQIQNLRIPQKGHNGKLMMHESLVGYYAQLVPKLSLTKDYIKTVKGIWNTLVDFSSIKLGLEVLAQI